MSNLPRIGPWFRLLPALAVALTLAASVHAQPKVSGYVQTTMIRSESNEAFVFGFERVRLQAAGSFRPEVGYKVLVDFVETDPLDNDGDTPAIIKVAEVVYTPVPKLNVSVGKFKTPIGMEWNTGAPDLDFVKRGLGQALIFHFDTGIMAHGTGIGGPGFGYAAGVFNAGPNKANEVGDPASGQDYTVAGRLSLDPSSALHGEAFFGSAVTHVAGQENVNVVGAGARWIPVRPLCLKAEALSREDGQNPASDGTDLYVQAAFRPHPRWESLVKFETLDVAGSDRDQTNVTVGLNWCMNPESRRQARILVNGVFSDLKGNDAVQVLYQVAF
ncbi:MAG: porin [bacterium]|nr:porin [bacterium]